MGRDIIAICSAPGDRVETTSASITRTPCAQQISGQSLGSSYTTQDVGITRIPGSIFLLPLRALGQSFPTFSRSPDELRVGLIAAWDDHCRNSITTTASLTLTKISGITLTCWTSPFLGLFNRYVLFRNMQRRDGTCIVSGVVFPIVRQQRFHLPQPNNIGGELRPGAPGCLWRLLEVQSQYCQ